MANGKINLGKQSGGVLSLTFPDGATNTEVMLPESGTVASINGTVTDNAIARYDGTTGKLQGSGVIINDSGNVGIGTTTDNGVDKLQVNGSIISRSAQYKYNDLNNANTVDEKIIVNNNCLNIPVNDYGYVTIQVSTPYQYCMQTFVCFSSPARLFIRVLAGGTWSPWTEK